MALIKMMGDLDNCVVFLRGKYEQMTLAYLGKRKIMNSLERAIMAAQKRYSGWTEWIRKMCENVGYDIPNAKRNKSVLLIAESDGPTVNPHTRIRLQQQLRRP